MSQFSINLPIITNPRADAAAVFRGTAAEMIQKGVKINGKEVDAIAMGVFAKYGLVETLGDAAKVAGKRGRVGKVLAFVPGVEFKVEF